MEIPLLSEEVYLMETCYSILGIEFQDKAQQIWNEVVEGCRHCENHQGDQGLPEEAGSLSEGSQEDLARTQPNNETC
jgi:hypothetical protein